MPNRDGIVSIGFDYKKDLEKMIKDFETEMNAVSSNTQLSKGMKKQFDNILAEMREFKASMDKELANLGSGKVSQSSFKSFKQTVENKFKGIREDIDRLDLAVATLNDSMGILGKGVDLSKISNDFKNFEDYVTRTNSAVENLIHTLGEQGISLFSFDNRNISDVQSIIRRIDNELKQLDKDTGAEFELFNEKQAQDELNRLSVQLTSTLELMENAKKQMETMDTSTEGFKKVRGEFALLQLKAASLNDTIEMLYEVTESKDMHIEMDDKSLSMYEKYTDELADNLETITSYAKNAKKELSSLLDTQKSPVIKVSSEMNPNSSELSTVVTIDTTSSELWKKLSPIMQDLQGILNSNPVIAPVKLVVAPTAVSSVETGNLDISNSYSKKYAKVLAQTGEDAVVDLEGVYKKTFTSVMDTATSYAKETIGKIQEVFDKNRIGVKFEISQEEIDKIQNFVLSNKDGKKVDISGQITKAKQEVEELNVSIEKTAKLLDDTKSKGNIKFDGFDKFTQDVSKSIGKLEELQNILKALQNIEITLAKASGIASITELDNQWANVEKRILNATKLDGSFRKNASVSKIASEYQKYIDMGGANSIADIDKIKDNKDTLDAIISKAKEFAKQDLSNDSVKELSIELDGIIGKFDELIATVKTATNALYKIIKQTGVSELDKQWSSITNKFKAFSDESGKINLSKQRKDVEELLVMYQRYVNMGGSHTPFDLTDNLETVAKLDKAYKKLNETKPIDNSSTIKSETESFKQVEQSVDSLTKAIGDTKVQAINVEATAMEDAAEREVFAIHAIYENLGLIVDRLKEIKGIKIPKIKVENVDSPVETNILSGTQIKDVFQGDDASKINEVAEATNNLADAENRLNIVEDKKSAQKYWQDRFKDSISDMTKTNDELVKMKSYYEDLQKETAKLDNSVSLLSALDKYTDTTKYTSEFISRVNSAQSEIKKIDVASPEGLDRLKEIDLIVGKIISDSKLLENKLIKQDSKIADIISKMKIFRDSNTNMSKSQRADLQALIDSAEVMAKTGDVTAEAIEHIKIGFSGIKAEVTTTGNTGLKMIDRIVQRTKDMNAKFIAQFFSWQDWLRYLREGFTIIKELDTALVDLKKTTAMNSSQLEEFYFDSNDVAKKMGVTTQSIIEQASAWSRLGYSTKEASTQMAELSSQFASISPGMSTDDAQEGLVSIMKAWDISTDQVEREVMDNINVLGNKFAETNQDIVEGMKRSASTFAALGQTWTDAFALFTGAQEVIQNAETVGTALKTLSLRIRGYSEETEELDSELANIVGEVIDLTKTASNPQGISLFTDASQEHYKSMVDYLGEISDIWDEIDEKSRTQLLEKLFGKRGASVGSAIIGNFDAVRDALKEMEGAAGAADAEMGIIQESIDFKLNALKETWVGTAQAIVDRGDLGAAIDGLTKLSEAIGWVIDKFGVLGTTAIVGGGILGGKNLGKTYKCTVFKLNCFEYALYA